MLSKRTIQALNQIDHQDREDAEQEAHLAVLEGRDPVKAVWSFAWNERTYREHFIPATDLDVDLDNI